MRRTSTWKQWCFSCLQFQNTSPCCTSSDGFFQMWYMDLAADCERSIHSCFWLSTVLAENVLWARLGMCFADVIEQSMIQLRSCEQSGTVKASTGKTKRPFHCPQAQSVAVVIQHMVALIFLSVLGSHPSPRFCGETTCSLWSLFVESDQPLAGREKFTAWNH